MNNEDKLTHSQPISIPRNHHGRGRSVSVSSASSGSTSSLSELPTPPSPTVGRITIPSPSTSPILSYFLAQSPTKSPTTAASTFPFRKFGTTPVFEEDESIERELPVTAHARRASTTVATRLAQPQSAFPLADASQADRGSNLLRRLSLSSGAFIKPPTNRSPPSPPPNSAITPISPTAPQVRKPRRSATISTEGARPRRAPSPMGERILKGHFDGFN